MLTRDKKILIKLVWGVGGKDHECYTGLKQNASTYIPKNLGALFKDIRIVLQLMHSIIPYTAHRYRFWLSFFEVYSWLPNQTFHNSPIIYSLFLFGGGHILEALCIV